MRRLTTFFIVFHLLLVAPASAEDAPRVFVDSPGQVLRTAPMGASIARLEKNTEVTVEGEDGDWIKVSITGWIRRAAVAARREAPAQSTALRQVEITEFQISREERTANSPERKALLVLTVKNSGRSDVRSWKGILVVQDSPTDVLFTTRVSHPDANLKPGETGEVKFYWNEGESQYRKLLDTPKENILLRLLQVEID
ncbi:MAG: hypothetical protein KDD44_02820 [Bdellovibrionales bacterium]|nr:hypothetical protein [Bdellovibrionales bacterium]